MVELIIDKKRCKGCGLCIAFCPCGCLELSSSLNKKGFNYPEKKNTVECKGCGICYRVCPDWCIEIYERVEE
ncbi:MAG: hypothetical protein B6D56_06290 [Candidatus Omnitrophica bacterium 4484_70.1]|nr:MAG: hypothetical protein B6D56_06290 [Candidatus Omnitrophica bacterium 4484_70.1]